MFLPPPLLPPPLLLLLLLLLLLSVFVPAVVRGAILEPVPVNHAFPPLVQMILKHQLRWSDEQISDTVTKYDRAFKDTLRESAVKGPFANTARFQLTGTDGDDCGLLAVLNNNIRLHSHIQVSLNGFATATKQRPVAAPCTGSLFQRAITLTKSSTTQAAWLNNLISTVGSCEMPYAEPVLRLAKTAASLVLQSLQLIGKFFCTTCTLDKHALLEAMQEMFHFYYGAEHLLLAAVMFGVRRGRVEEGAPRLGNVLAINAHVRNDPLLQIDAKEVTLNIGRLYKSEEELLARAKANANRLICGHRSLNVSLLDDFTGERLKDYWQSVSGAKEVVSKASSYKDLLSLFQTHPHPTYLGFSNIADSKICESFIHACTNSTANNVKQLPSIIRVIWAPLNSSFQRAKFTNYALPKYFTHFFHHRLTPRLPAPTMATLRITLGDLSDDLMLHVAVLHEAAESKRVHPGAPLKPVHDLRNITETLNKAATDFGEHGIGARFFVAQLLKQAGACVTMEAVYATTDCLVFLDGFGEQSGQMSTERYFEKICLQTLSSLQFSNSSGLLLLRAYFLMRTYSTFRALNVAEDQVSIAKIESMVMASLAHFTPSRCGV